MAMIPHQTGAGAIMAGQAARGFGGAMWHALRAGVVAQPQPVTIQVPTGGMNAASAAAMTAIAAQVSAEAAAFIQRVTPYVKGSFYGFMIILCLVIVEKVYTGPVGALLGAASRGLLVILRAGVPVGRAGVVRFIKAVTRVLKALFALPAAVRDAILERAAAVQNWAHRKIHNVREGMVVVHGYVKSSRNAVVGTMRRSLARVKAAGVRVRTAAGGFRARLKAKENAATMARNQKIRANLAGINQRVTANEERRIQSLINKVKRTSVPLTGKEKREYLKLTRREEKSAMMNVNSAARALTNLRKRRSH